MMLASFEKDLYVAKRRQGRWLRGKEYVWVK